MIGVVVVAVEIKDERGSSAQKIPVKHVNYCALYQTCSEHGASLKFLRSIYKIGVWSKHSRTQLCEFPIRVIVRSHEEFL